MFRLKVGTRRIWSIFMLLGEVRSLCHLLWELSFDAVYSLQLRNSCVFSRLLDRNRREDNTGRRASAVSAWVGTGGLHHAKDLDIVWITNATPNEPLAETGAMSSAARQRKVHSPPGL